MAEKAGARSRTALNVRQHFVPGVLLRCPCRALIATEFPEGGPPPQLFALGHKNSPEIGFSLVPWRIFHRPQDTSPEIPVPSRGHGKFQGSLGEVRALGIFIRDKGNSLTPLHPQKSR